MMTQAFYTGISGLKTYSSGIDVVSNNLANISTNGFRAYNAEYANLFDKTLATASQGLSSDVGVGVQLKTTSMSQSQGALQLTGRSTDLAIEGDGWFGVQGNGAPVYTRDGAFTFDKNDDLVTVEGKHVLGTMGGNIDDTTLTKQLAEVKLGDAGSVEKLRFPKTLTYPPVPTQNAKFMGNLGTDVGVKTMSAGVVDPKSNKNNLRLEFQLSATQPASGTQWDVKAQTKSLDGQTVYDTKTGTATFDSAGSLISTTLTSIDNNGQQVNIDLGSSFSGVTAITNIPVSASSLADGTIGGDLRGYDINKNGEVVATFTNGKQSAVGKIAVFHFQNNQGLNRLNGSQFQESSNSGKAFFQKGANGENILGAGITNFKLEASNATTENGLTNLIILQRSYDANSKSVTTADQMIQKALNMNAGK